MDKQELRNKMKERLRSLSPEEKQRQSRMICDKLRESSLYREAESVALYMPRSIEPDVTPLLYRAIEEKGWVAVPRCGPEMGQMDFFILRGEEDLSRGAYGILEPVSGCERAELSAKTLLVVPALAYSRSGARLGNGGGYYDRFLARFAGKTVGVCFLETLLATLPQQKYDRGVAYLCVPGALYQTEGGEPPYEGQ